MFPKDGTHYYYSWWKNDTKALHILPQDWNSPVPVGEYDCQPSKGRAENKQNLWIIVIWLLFLEVFSLG